MNALLREVGVGAVCVLALKSLHVLISVEQREANFFEKGGRREESSRSENRTRYSYVVRDVMDLSEASLVRQVESL